MAPSVKFCLLVFMPLLAHAVKAEDAKPNFYISTPRTKPPEKAASPKPSPTPAVKPAALKPKPSPTPAPPSSQASLRSRENPPERPFDPPSDPLGLARAFRHRWDFSTFLVTVDEELKFRLDAARSRTLRLARAFSALSHEVEVRQRNLNSAALAAYLLSRDQQTWVPAGGRSLTDAQMLAVEITMRQDIKAMEGALTDYETLRTTLNASAEELSGLEKKGLSAAKPNALAEEDPDRPTLPLTAVAKAQTQGVLEERAVPVEALKAILASESLTENSDSRQSIASFAPPPPAAALGAAPPTLYTPDQTRIPAPQNTRELKRPEQHATLIPTGVNAPVHAVRKGVVVYAGPFRGYGSMVILEHDKGTFSIYSHLGTVQVREREAINAGTILGRAGIPPELGRSGIHFQVRQGKVPVKPEDWLGPDQVEKLVAGK